MGRVRTNKRRRRSGVCSPARACAFLISTLLGGLLYLQSRYLNTYFSQPRNEALLSSITAAEPSARLPMPTAKFPFVVFDGRNFADVDGALDSPTGSITASLWLWLESTSVTTPEEQHTVLANRHGGCGLDPTNFGYALVLRAARTPTVGQRHRVLALEWSSVTSGCHTLEVPSSAMVAGRWLHVAFSFSPTAARQTEAALQVNGEAVHITTRVRLPQTHVGAKMRIGSCLGEDVVACGFQGGIGNIALWATVRNLGDVAREAALDVDDSACNVVRERADHRRVGAAMPIALLCAGVAGSSDSPSSESVMRYGDFAGLHNVLTWSGGVNGRWLKAPATPKKMEAPQQQQQQAQQQGHLRNQVLGGRLMFRAEQQQQNQRQAQVHHINQDVVAQRHVQITTVPVAVQTMPNVARKIEMEAKSPSNSASTDTLENAAIMIMAHSRTDVLRRVIEALLAAPSDDLQRFRVYVSLDQPNGGVEQLVKSYGARLGGILRHYPQPGDGSPRFVHALQNIAIHFKRALIDGFGRMKFSHIIFLEDDILPSRDFLALFRHTAPILKTDKTVWCVSAWNDNGLSGLVDSTSLVQLGNLRRTGYFPGLGWMTSAEVWRDIASKWPNAPTTGWDHWMRVGGVSRGRDCIVPEINRVAHIGGDSGTNVHDPGNQIYGRFPPAAHTAPFTPLQQLMNENYKARMQKIMDKASRRPLSELSHVIHEDTQEPIVVLYQREQYQSAVRDRLGLVHPQPRGWYHGILPLRRGGGRGGNLFLVDKRVAADFLKPNERLKRAFEMKEIAAKPGQSCDTVCAQHSLRCNQEQLEFVNDCVALKRAFPCEEGCGHQVGIEIPCYVHDAGRDTSHQCLVTDEAVSTCSASHPATTRLCACV